MRRAMVYESDISYLLHEPLAAAGTGTALFAHILEGSPQRVQGTGTFQHEESV